jgi:uncharacterized protein
MITYSIYELTVPSFTRSLNTLKAQLKKAEDFAAARNVDANKLLHDRIIFDQFPLVKQVQLCTDIAKRTAGMLAKMEIPKYEDNEETFAQLYSRIEKTIEFLSTITAEKMEISHTEVIPMSWMPTKGIPANEYVSHYATPNFFFHATVAYSIMRKNGVALGKGDYLGQLPLVDVK